MQENRTLVIPVAIGLLAFALVTGGAILAPGNIAWLRFGDPQQHYLGWLFFRNSDWTMPLGLNPRFGLELGSAIVFSDSLPLLALPFKALADWLPPEFQYFGIWVLACFLLQAVFAWKIGGLLTSDRLARAAIAGFFVFAPPMLWRLHGHISLFSHFLILAAIYLALTSRRRHRSLAFGILVVLSAAVHAYLLAMVAAIWLATLGDGLWRRSARPFAVAAEVLAVGALTGLACWQIGYFSIGDGVASGGYGFYRMNLLSLIDPDGWSRVLGDVPGGEGDYEGFNYLGLGLLLVALASLPVALAPIRRLAHLAKAMPVLSLLALALAVFAVSNTVGLASLGVGIPIPALAERLANVFRSSGRMFWPVYYLIVIAILFVALRGWGIRRARWLLAGALLVQVADTSAGWTFRSAQLAVPPASAWETSMRDPFWQEAARRYRNVRWIAPMNHAPDWAAISTFAATNGLATDATFLARTSQPALDGARVRAARQLASGVYEADSLYILDVPSTRQAAQTLGADDMIAMIDGFRVLAPGWRTCAQCRQDYPFDRASLFGPVVLGREIAFAADAGALYLTSGWGQPEPWGIWSGDDTVSFGFASPLPSRFRLTLRAQAFGPNADRPFELRAGDATAQFRIPATLSEIALDIDTGVPTDRLEIRVPAAVSPNELLGNGDIRRLGIGLAGLRIDPLSP